MIKFYCKECGKEMWQGVKWEAIKNLTLEKVENSLICSNCVAKRIKNDIDLVNLLDTGE